MATKNKNLDKKIVKTFIDLLYMTSSEVLAKDISDLLQGTPGITIELWEEMNILELQLSNENSIDLEPLSTTSFKTPSDVSFVRNRDIKTVFAINLCDTDMNILTPIFEKIIEKYSGFLCADTEDFLPVYVGSSKKQL